ncbi:BTAD domain-containing putative transcriptional regulator [Glycomyces sp. NPDC047010]|uniref:AfsR/SARP family transcriptional regulator n=1 Tax=Glycomyces sp. NPDC047010 TaxID=3155023 RepID=UPI0033C5A0CC
MSDRPVVFRVLGPLELEIAGRAVPLHAAKPRALLGLLLLNANGFTESDRLIDQLWAGRPPASADTTLRSYVYQLRRRLEPLDGASIEGRSGGYRLAVREGLVDADRFTSLISLGRKAFQDAEYAAAAAAYREGLALWRGPAFDGLDVPAVRDRARTLDDLRGEALEACIGIEMEHTAAPAPLAELEALVAAHPLREGPWRLLMLGLSRAGRQAEALDAYRRLFRILDEELGVRPSDSIEELHREILTGAVHPQPRTAAPAVPRQLPAAAPYFTGRAAQTAELDALLPGGTGDRDAHAATVALVTGTAGIGKTTLAVQWAHRAADRFPDGQLYVNLRGFDPAGTPAEPTEALIGFLRALGALPETLPEGLDALAGAFRTLTADKRVLVVLDNARSFQQVLPLLPGAPQSMALVTSRSRLSGLIAHGAQPIPLPILDDADAMRFMDRRLREPRTAAEPEAARAIVDACSGLPLALAIAAARASADPHFPLADLAAEMRGAGDRLDALADPDQAADLRAVFSWSYRALTPDTGRLFRLLGLHPGPDFPTAAAAAAAGTTPRRATRMLTELTRANLLTEPAPGRFAFHDLLRAYAAECAEAEDPQADRAAAARRVLDFYLHTTYAAQRIVAPARDAIDLVPASPGVEPAPIADVPSAVAWFTAEHATLIAAVGYAADRGLDSHCWQLAWTVRDLIDRARWHGLAPLLRTGLDATRRLGDRAARARLCSILAQNFAHLGDPDDASAHADEALALCEELGDRAGQAHALHVHARIRIRRGRIDEAIACGMRALDLYRAARHEAGEAHVLNSIGWWHCLSGDHEAALHYCGRAMSVMERIEDRIGQADTADSIGHAHMMLGHHTEAVERYRHAIGIYRSLGAHQAEALTCEKLGDTLHAAGDRAAARESWRHALDTYAVLEPADEKSLRAKIDGLAAAVPEG